MPMGRDIFTEKGIWQSVHAADAAYDDTSALTGSVPAGGSAVLPAGAAACRDDEHAAMMLISSAAAVAEYI